MDHPDEVWQKKYDQRGKKEVSHLYKMKPPGKSSLNKRLTNTMNKNKKRKKIEYKL